ASCLPRQAKPARQTIYPRHPEASVAMGGRCGGVKAGLTFGPVTRKGSSSRAYRACRAGFASRGTPVARGTTPSRSRLAPTRDMGLGSRRRLRLIEALRVLEVRAEELCHRAALEAVHEPVIEGHAERHDRTRDDPS